MVLFKKNCPEYLVEFYLKLPRISLRNEVASINGNHCETKININLFNFNLTTSKKYFIIEVTVIFGIGLKVIDKEIT